MLAASIAWIDVRCRVSESYMTPFSLRFFPAKPIQEAILATLSKPSISAGVGIVYRLDPVRVEMSFGLPIVAAKGEGARKGFQLGIGLEFL